MLHYIQNLLGRLLYVPKGSTGITSRPNSVVIIHNSTTVVDLLLVYTAMHIGTMHRCGSCYSLMSMELLMRTSACTDNVTIWMCSNRFQLNLTKTTLLWLPQIGQRCQNENVRYCQNRVFTIAGYHSCCQKMTVSLYRKKAFKHLIIARYSRLKFFKQNKVSP